MNPNKVKNKYMNSCKKSSYKTTPASYPTNSKPKEVYALRSSDKHDSAGIWVKVFLC